MAAEPRLIDANKPIEETESIINFRLCHHMPTEDYESFLNYLKKQPTVDAVEVVRCRDCKHAGINENHPSKPLLCFLTRMCGSVDPEWYCWQGERKGNDN